MPKKPSSNPGGSLSSNPSSSGVAKHPLAGKLPLGPIHPTLPVPILEAANGPAALAALAALATSAAPATPAAPTGMPSIPSSIARPKNATVASKLIATRQTDITLDEINSYLRTADDRSTLAITCNSNLLWLVKHAAARRKLNVKQLVIGCLLQALTEDPPLPVPPVPPVSDSLTEPAAIAADVVENGAYA